MTRMHPFLFAVLAFATFPAWSDTLILDNGRSLDGQILKETERGVVFKLVTGSEITLPLESIAEIVRSGTGERLLAEGDAQFKRGNLAKALELYREASEEHPEESLSRIEKVREAAGQDFEKRFGGLPPDEAERRLRVEIQASTPDDPSLDLARKNLARVLFQKGKTAHQHMLFEKSAGFFQEAWQLDRSFEGVGPLLLEAQRRMKVPDSRILAFLEEFHLEHPSNPAMNEMLALYVWKKSPCQAAELLFPDGQPSSATDPMVVEILPQVLRNCFYTEPYPWDAALDRERCYELYLGMVPSADRSPLFELRIEADPEDRILLEDYANYLVDRGDLDEGIEIQKRILELDPSDSSVAGRIRALESARVQREIDSVEQDLARLERPLQLLAKVTPESFPTLGPGPELNELMAKGKRLADLVAARPMHTVGAPPDHLLGALKEYRTVLTSPEVKHDLDEVLKHHSGFRSRIQSGDMAPVFEGTALDGSTVRLADYRGNVVLLYFWATWCPACKAEFPEVKQLNKSGMLGDDFVLVGVSLDTDRKRLEQFLSVNPDADWPQIFSGKGWDSPIASLYGVEETPMSILIDREGKIRDMKVRGHRLFLRSIELTNEGTNRTLQVYGQPPP